MTEGHIYKSLSVPCRQSSVVGRTLAVSRLTLADSPTFSFKCNQCCYLVFSGLTLADSPSSVITVTSAVSWSSSASCSLWSVN